MEIRENIIKRKLSAGEIATVVSGFNSPDIIDFLGQFGFDGVWIEAEHGPIDFSDIPNLTRASDLWGMSSIVRVRENNYSLIYRTLDLGAQGIVVPHVDTAKDARDLVRATKFSPIGARGMFSGRQSWGVENYLENANSQVLSVALIEDIVAINNLDEILSVDDIDVFFVAPSDLAQSMGHFGNNNHEEVRATIANAIAKINDRGRCAGALVADSNLEEYIDWGARLIMVSWNSWLSEGAKKFVERIPK
ncbi:MAG: hypothetical protein CL735_01865 [Chloroflexi bacterium]|nr:hypothetical protein [Chloroflexota bacterium]|tara:strand:- start:20736 stop:21482 length:747 start_codon:yes stop_codon:yes gene_type:complete